MVIDRKKNAASCNTCEVINSCKIKDNILDPVTVYANCAESGCVRYKGPGFQYGGFASKAILRHLKTGAIITEKIALENYGCGKKRLHDNVERFSKTHNIEKHENEGEVFYLLILPKTTKIKKQKTHTT